MPTLYLTGCISRQSFRTLSCQHACTHSFKTGYEPKTLNLKQMLEYSASGGCNKRRTKFDLIRHRPFMEGLIEAVDILML